MQLKQRQKAVFTIVCIEFPCGAGTKWAGISAGGRRNDPPGIFRFKNIPAKAARPESHAYGPALEFFGTQLFAYWDLGPSNSQIFWTRKKSAPVSL
jgi:hypothetical protein